MPEGSGGGAWLNCLCGSDADWTYFVLGPSKRLVEFHDDGNVSIGLRWQDFDFDCIEEFGYFCRKCLTLIPDPDDEIPWLMEASEFDDRSSEIGWTTGEPPWDRSDQDHFEHQWNEGCRMRIDFYQQARVAELAGKAMKMIGDRVVPALNQGGLICPCGIEDDRWIYSELIPTEREARIDAQGNLLLSEVWADQLWDCSEGREFLCRSCLTSIPAEDVDYLVGSREMFEYWKLTGDIEADAYGLQKGKVLGTPDQRHQAWLNFRIDRDARNALWRRVRAR